LKQMPECLLWLLKLYQDFPQCYLRVNQIWLYLCRPGIMLQGIFPIRSQEVNFASSYSECASYGFSQGGLKLLLRATLRILAYLVAQDCFSQFEVHAGQYRVDRQSLFVLRDSVRKIP